MLAAGVAFAGFGLGERLDLKLLDSQFRLLRAWFPQPVAREVVVVGIDEDTAKRFPEPITLWHAHLSRFLGANVAQAHRSGEAHIMGGSIETMVLTAVALLLLVATMLMAVIVAQLKAMRREVEAARKQLATMDWSQMLFNGVQQLKDIVKGLDIIDKRLQKLEAIEKVQLSNINIRAGR